ncbi:MAG: alpha/beta hydrolase [Bosea sp. (in: a-proteobacteria)]
MTARVRVMFSSARFIALLCVSALLVSGCAGERKDVFAPLGQGSSNAKPLHMLVATTRGRATNQAELFSGERGQLLSLAEISISVPPASARQIGEVQWPKSMPGNPETDFVVTATDTLNPVTVRERLRQRLKQQGHGRVLLFVHGYNNKFADAVFRFAQISHDSGAPSLPILFTWPSRASALAYGYDKESANYSRDSLELAIRALFAEPSVKEIDILAHSMGNWVTLESLRQMAIRDGKLPAKIKNVMLAAPDVDVDVFGMQIARMGKPRPRFTLFASQDDRALAFSRRIQGGIDRLGQVDVAKEPLRSELAAQGVEVLDLTSLKGADSFNHGKFAESPPVVQFIGRRLAAGQELDDNKPSFGEHVSSLSTRAGAVAGLIVAAPLSVLDPDSSRTFGAQLNSALNNVEQRDDAQIRADARLHDFKAREQQLKLLEKKQP